MEPATGCLIRVLTRYRFQRSYTLPDGMSLGLPQTGELTGVHNILGGGSGASTPTCLLCRWGRDKLSRNGQQGIRVGTVQGSPVCRQEKTHLRIR